MEDQTQSVPIPRISDLIGVALDGLPEMYDAQKGLFCYALKDGRFLNGVSERYSLICLIGLYRAEQSGYRTAFDLAYIFDQAAKMPDPDVSDLGLLLWAGALIGQKDLDKIYQSLSAGLNGNRLYRLPGMDLGVALSGLVAYARVSGSNDAHQTADTIKDFIFRHCVHTDSHLFYHEAGRTFRSVLPNFATQIYLMYGLIHYAQLSDDSNVAGFSARCIDTLCGLQLEDGGWPWIYHACGRVIEPYEIYSVHQDAMMPMVLQAMQEVNSESYGIALKKGLSWLLGGNSLGLNMVDLKNNFIFRSLRRSTPLYKVVGGINALYGSVLKRPLFRSSNLEIDHTCRSYHLGWILEAWCGREALLDDV